MCTKLFADLQQMIDSRNTCLQETSLPDSESLRETDNSFWQGLPQDKPRQHGVGFAVRNSLLVSTETPLVGSSRILTLRMKTSLGFVNIISASTLTLTSSPKAEDQFYEDF